jgi:hypothetical protein
LDQSLFDIAFDLDLVRPLGLRPGVQGRREPGGDQAAADTADGTDADAEGSDDLLVGVPAAYRGVRQQEDAGVGESAGSPFPGGDQVFQVGSFLCG